MLLGLVQVAGKELVLKDREEVDRLMESARSRYAAATMIQSHVRRRQSVDGVGGGVGVGGGSSRARLLVRSGTRVCSGGSSSKYLIMSVLEEGSGARVRVRVEGYEFPNKDEWMRWSEKPRRSTTASSSSASVTTGAPATATSARPQRGPRKEQPPATAEIVPEPPSTPKEEDASSRRG